LFIKYEALRHPQLCGLAIDPMFIYATPPNVLVNQLFSSETYISAGCIGGIMEELR